MAFKPLKLIYNSHFCQLLLTVLPTLPDKPGLSEIHVIVFIDTIRVIFYVSFFTGIQIIPVTLKTVIYNSHAAYFDCPCYTSSQALLPYRHHSCLILTVIHSIPVTFYRCDLQFTRSHAAYFDCRCYTSSQALLP